MSLDIARADLFGAGGGEPWSAALGAGAGRLVLVRDDGTEHDGLEADRWIAPADAADRSAIAGLTGPLLDVGCGPGRMVRAALDAGLPAWGIDATEAAVERCRAAGLPVLRRDVFAPLPREGGWASVLLLDGNIGIGGDVPALLARCRALLRPGGVLVAEAHPDAERDTTDVVRVRDDAGRESGPFRWAQAGLPALLRAAHGFDVERLWELGGRWFVRLRLA